ncbi:MAG: glycosyltransferase family 2 protein [Armatimonadetes bacterium]|nr:glycosyltransferase family 2 protein [Armatimonadota bacterium]
MKRVNMPSFSGVRSINMDRPFLSLIIPAYNEAKRIKSTFETVSAFLETLGRDCEIIAVNDGSTDDTHRVMVECASEATAVRIINYETNRGKGYAVRQGVFASRGEYIAFTDADLSAPIDQLAKLFAVIEKGYDVAIGSRAVKGAEIPVRQPLYRELGGKALNLLIQLLAVPGVRDTQCGLKLFRGDVARAIFEKCFIDGWAFDVEVLFLARRYGYRIAEVPVRWSHAESSSMRPFRAGLQVLGSIIRMRMHRYEAVMVESGLV